MAKPTIARCVAIAFYLADWRPKHMATQARRLFSSTQKWIRPLALRTHENFATKPALDQLERFISTDIAFRQAVKTNNIKKVRLSRVLGRRSDKSLEWQLPKIADVGELGQWLALSNNDLQWLANLKGNSLRPNFKVSDHYVCTWIKKRSTGYRLIESPKSLLKEVQRQILEGLVSRIPTHDAAHGFCKGRSVVSFVQPHVRKRFCLKLDLKDFFPSVQFGRVWGLLQTAGYQKEVARYLAALCTHSVDNETLQEGVYFRGADSAEARSLYSPRHLPQGAPTSPALANLIAFRLDSRLSGLVDQISKSNPDSNVAYTRYADDILISANDRLIATRRFAVTVGAIALEEGFQIHFRKTRLMTDSQQQLATGIVINQETNLARTEFDRLKAILHNCVKHGIDSQNRKSYPNFREHLIGRIGWVAQLNPKKAAKLQALFDQIE